MDSALAAQNRFFQTGATRDLSFRRNALRKLEAALRANESDLMGALKRDLGKDEHEAYLTELFLVYLELKQARRRMGRWARRRRARTPLFHLPARAYVQPRPRGRVLIMSPWNYPVYLLLVPLIGAVAAGNCVVVRPSSSAPATAAVIRRVLEQAFAPEHIAVFEGDRSVARELLMRRHDLICFTGSEAVGREVMRAAAQHLTPVVLELGGKSPCIVDRNVDLSFAARRIAWGKYLNAGQTCVAPDYVLADRVIADRLVSEIDRWVKRFYGDDPQCSVDYARIVGAGHFDRLAELLNGAQILAGGRVERADLYIEPTIVRCEGMDQAPMQEEIFGPILPVLSYDTPEEAIELALQRPEPLALYIFSSNQRFCDQMIDQLPAGGVTVNDTVAHLTAHDLPFGGIGRSGMGAYHGRHSFDTFSHLEPVLRKRGYRLDLPFRYPPFGPKSRWFRLVRRFYA